MATQFHSPFLWPASKVSLWSSDFYRRTTPDEIERKLRLLFPSGHPVLCSSGRAGLSLLMSSLEMGRSDFVGVFPFASHCVFDAITRTASVVPLGDKRSGLDVVYHQWGFETGYMGKMPLIEDCVDSLSLPGSELFTSGGIAEVWSLSKILASPGGGVVWCKDEELASKMRSIRDERGERFGQYFLKFLASKSHWCHLLWQGAEPNSGNPSRLQTNELSKFIDRWAHLVVERKKKLELLTEFIPPKFVPLAGKLPCVAPLMSSETNQSVIERHGLSIGVRHFSFFSQGQHKHVPVLPLPIHQDVSFEALESLVLDLRSAREN